MKPFVYDLPVKIAFGENTSENLAELSRRLGERGFVIADAYYKSDPRFTDFYNKHKNLFCDVWSDVVPNPSITSVKEAARTISASHADFVLAVGGGSAIDTAKAACLTAATGIDIEDYHSGKVPVGSQSIPLVAMPTTSGTGSEVTPVSVLSNHESGVKGPVAGSALLPKLAIVDPVWMVTMPQSVTASTGMDALSHAIEAYWSKGSLAICDAYAEKAVVLIMQNLLKTYQDGENIQARSNMALAALLAGMAFGQPKNAAVHACSFPLTGKYNMPHGTACAFTLDLFLRHNATALPEKLTYLSHLAGFETTEEFADAIHDLKIKMDLPATFDEAGIPAEDIESIVDASFHPLMRNNPVEVSKEELLSLYRSIME